MNIQYYNCPVPQPFDAHTLPKDPDFLTHQVDLEQLEQVARKYGQYKNLLVIGNGGSISSIAAMYGALQEQATKQLYILNTVDPDYIYALKKKLSPEDTLVCSVSKSGQNTTQMESLMSFVDYPAVYMADQGSPLAEVAHALKKEIIYSPAIGDRYAGLAATALFPALLCGLDAKAIYKAGRAIQRQYGEDNPAWKTASILWQLEQKGVDDVFVPIYSHNLSAAGGLITQLCHESFGKDGKGQTYFVAEGPEWQHHTTQRFYGRPENVAGFFITVDNFMHPAATSLPAAVHSIQFKGQPLFTLDKIPLEKALAFEWQGNMEDARLNNIPLLHLSVTGLHEQDIGNFIAFWQLYAVYGSTLRGVNPFDQPKVESSKIISFDKRLQFKGLL